MRGEMGEKRRRREEGEMGRTGEEEEGMREEGEMIRTDEEEG